MWALNPVTIVLIRDKREDTDTQREEVLVKMEAEIGVMRPQADERLEPSEAGRGKGRIFSARFQREHALDFGLLASRTTRE